MKGSTVFLMTLFLIVGLKFQLFSQLSRLDSLQSKKYPGLIFWIEKNSYDSHFAELGEYGKHWDGQPTIPTILKNMDTCFNKAVEKYEDYLKQNKELPSCLKNGLNRLLEKLKKPGKPFLKCTWYKDPNIPWPFVYRQKHFDLLKAESGGTSTTAEQIYLITLWQITYEYKFDEEKPKTVLTASILMHELIHCVKKHYPECFKILEEPEEEGTTEDGELKICGEENCGTYYKDYKGWKYKCTDENICECDCLDKKSNFF